MQDVYKGVDFDPTDDHHAPWQSGMTGLGYDSAVTGDLTSLDALWTDDPRWKGKVTFLTEMRDTIGLTHAPARQGPVAGDRGRRSTRPIAEMPEGGRRRDRPGVHRQRLRRGPRRRATSSWRWPGRATSSPSRPRRRRSSGSSPTRAACSGRTTCSSRRAPPHKYTAELMIDFVLRPGDRRADRGLRELRHPGQGRQGGARRRRSGARRQPADLPARRRPRQGQDLQEPDRGRGDRTSTTSSRR